MVWTTTGPHPRYCPTCGGELGDAVFDGEPRSYCERFERPIFRNPVPLARVAVIADESVLLIERGAGADIGAWALPGVHVRERVTAECSGTGTRRGDGSDSRSDGSQTTGDGVSGVRRRPLPGVDQLRSSAGRNRGPGIGRRRRSGRSIFHTRGDRKRGAAVASVGAGAGSHGDRRIWGELAVGQKESNEESGAVRVRVADHLDAFEPVDLVDDLDDGVGDE